MNMLSKAFFLRQFFYLFAPILIAKRLVKAEMNRYILSKRNLPRFSFREILDRYHSKPGKAIVVLGAGASIDDLTDSDYKKFSKYLTIGMRKTLELDFVPDILFAEYDDSVPHLAEEFVGQLNRKWESYLNTILMIEVADSSEHIQKFIYDNIHECLRTNIRFVSCLTSIGDSRILNYLIGREFFLRFLISRGILWHCRTSSFYAVFIAYALRISNVHLVGLDGYSGYLSFQDYKLAGPDSKNLRNQLHSTYDSSFGSPTILEAVRSMSKFIHFTVQSNKSIFSKYFEVLELP